MVVILASSVVESSSKLAGFGHGGGNLVPGAVDGYVLLAAADEDAHGGKSDGKDGAFAHGVRMIFLRF